MFSSGFWNKFIILPVFPVVAPIVYLIQFVIWDTLAYVPGRSAFPHLIRRVPAPLYMVSNQFSDSGGGG